MGGIERKHVAAFVGRQWLLHKLTSSQRCVCKQCCCVTECQSDCDECSVVGYGKCDDATHCLLVDANYDSAAQLCTGLS